MNSASVTASVDHLWRSQSLPMWLALAAAAFFALIVLVTLVRAEKSVANGALTVITLLAIGVAAAATLRGTDTGRGAAAASSPTVLPAQAASLPALSCLDDLAGDMVMTACEKVLFGSADSVAAAVSVTAARLDRLVALGGTAAADKVMTPELMASRRAMERDRYGLTAYVLQSRDHCMTGNCPAYASFTDHKQLDANMDGRTYEGLVTRYAPAWNAAAEVAATNPAAVAASSEPGAAVASNPALAGLPTTVPTGKPTTADFPSAASIPAVSIMTDTPVAAPKSAAPPPHPAKRAVAPRAAPKAEPRAEARTAVRPQAPAAGEPAQLAPQGAPADN